MKQLPTAYEFISERSGGGYIQEEILITFAKLHVKAALEAASEQGKGMYYNDYNEEVECSVDKWTILNAYDLNNIK